MKIMTWHTRILTYIILLTVTVIVILPFIWMVGTSLKEPGTVFEYPPRLMPQEFFWHNYSRAWQAIPFARGFFNSFFISLSITLGQLITCSLAAFAFARLKFPGRDKIFFLYLATLMVPTHVTMIPIFILLRLLPVSLNSLFHTAFWTSNLYIGNIYIGKPLGIDSYFALIVPFCFSAYGTFLLRQFFMILPRDLEEAAMLDGCNHFQIYSKIVLPLSKPALATLATLTFMKAWKNYLWPLIIANSPDLMPLSVMIQWLQGLHTTDWTLLMAGSVIVLFPVIVLFAFNQRFFIRSIQFRIITY